MIRPGRRALLVPFTAVALAATLTGCGAIVDSLLGDSPSDAQRDEPGGEITAASDADVFSLQVGDCLDYASQADDEQELFTLPVVPCGEHHDTEIYAEKHLTDEEFATIDTVADEFCYGEFAAYVGTSYEESTLDYSMFTPTDLSWEQGDDVLQCVVVHLDGGLTGSMRGSGL